MPVGNYGGVQLLLSLKQKELWEKKSVSESHITVSPEVLSKPRRASYHLRVQRYAQVQLLITSKKGKVVLFT